jgi:hypothetical protein
LRGSAATLAFESSVSSVSISARDVPRESSGALVGVEGLVFVFVFGGVEETFASARAPVFGRVLSRAFADAFASEGTSDLPRRLALAPARVGGALERCFRSLIEEFLASRRTLLVSPPPENASLLTSTSWGLDKS